MAFRQFFIKPITVIPKACAHFADYFHEVGFPSLPPFDKGGRGFGIDFLELLRITAQPMFWISAAVVIVAITLFLLAKRSEKGKPTQTALPYQKAEALFSHAERSFLGVLHQAVGNHAAVFGKVRVADVVEPKAGLARHARQTASNKISAEHFDFLLCDIEDLSVACAIELDDGSHQSKRRHQRDEFLRGVCAAAGIPLIQVPAQSAYIISEVKQLLPRYLTIKDPPAPESSPELAPQKPELNQKLCPNCSAVMVKRMAKTGKHAGKQFWVCSAYPTCKTMEAVTARKRSPDRQGNFES